MRSFRLLHTKKICIFINNGIFHLKKAVDHMRVFMSLSSSLLNLKSLCLLLFSSFKFWWDSFYDFKIKFCWNASIYSGYWFETRNFSFSLVFHYFFSFNWNFAFLNFNSVSFFIIIQASKSKFIFSVLIVKTFELIHYYHLSHSYNLDGFSILTGFYW